MVDKDMTDKLNHIKDETIVAIDHFEKYASVLNITDEKDKKIFSIGMNMLKTLKMDLESNRLSLGEVFDVAKMAQDANTIIRNMDNVYYEDIDRIVDGLRDQINMYNRETE